MPNREAKPSRYNALYRCWPMLFWRRCCGCKKEFRREWGWRAITPPYGGTMGTERFLCQRCAPTREKADEFFILLKWRRPRPAFPVVRG